MQRSHTWQRSMTRWVQQGTGACSAEGRGAEAIAAGPKIQSALGAGRPGAPAIHERHDIPIPHHQPYTDAYSSVCFVF